MTQKEIGPCTNNPLCIKGKETEPLLTNLRKGLIDPDTPQSAMTRKSWDGSTQKLVFSDEFNTDGRTFYDGDDSFFQAVDIWYGATQDLEVGDTDADIRGPILTRASGMILMQSTPRTAPSTSNLICSRTTVLTTGQACFSRGTSCATRVVILRLAFPCLAEAISVVFGLVFGLWVIWLAQDILAQQKGCGHTVIMTSAMLVLRQTRVPTMASAISRV